METIANIGVAFKVKRGDLKDAVKSAERLAELEEDGRGYIEIFAYSDESRFELRSGQDVRFFRLKIDNPRRKYAGIWTYLSPDDVQSDKSEEELDQNFELCLDSADYFEVQVNVY
jgi:hypothetical protein